MASVFNILYITVFVKLYQKIHNTTTFKVMDIFAINLRSSTNNRDVITKLFFVIILKIALV